MAGCVMARQSMWISFVSGSSSLNLFLGYLSLGKIAFFCPESTMRVFQKVNMSRSHVADLQPLERSLAVRKRENYHHLRGQENIRLLWQKLESGLH